MSGSSGRASCSSRSIVLAEIGRVGDQRHQILEDDPWLGEVRHVADAIAQIQCRPRGHRGTLALREESQLAPEEEPRELLRRLRERLEVVEAGLPALGVARTERRCDELFEEAGLAPGRVPERPQVPGVDPVLREPAAGRGDLGVALAVEVLATLDPRREQSVFLEGAREGRIDTGPVTELGEVELRLLLPQSGRPAALALRSPRRRMRAPA